MIKSSMLVFVQIWIRWSLPRLRIDQVMMTCLKYLVPISCFLFLASVVWSLALPGRTFFGVNAADSAASGLAVFDADAGFRDINFSPVLVLHLSRSWHVGAMLRFQRLLSDAADSPIVDDRGPPNQIIAALGLARTW